MTKKQVEEIVKRYPYIACAVKKNQGVAEFVSGGGKQKIPITEEVKAVCDIIDDIYLNTENIWRGFQGGAIGYIADTRHAVGKERVL